MRVRRQSDGGVRIDLAREEAAVLASLPNRLRRVLESPEPGSRVLERLFPAAYRDSEKEEEYRRLLGRDLLERRLETVRGFEQTLERAERKTRQLVVHLRPEDFELWLGFVNDMRILLGTELGIEEENWALEFDPDRPDAEDLLLLHFLSWLEEELLRRGSGYDLGP